MSLDIANPSFSLKVIGAARRVDFDFRLHGMSTTPGDLELLRAYKCLSRRKCNEQDRMENHELEKGGFIYEWTTLGETLVSCLNEPLGGDAARTRQATSPSRGGAQLFFGCSSSVTGGTRV